jgi:nicotinamide-nucleotide amidase
MRIELVNTGDELLLGDTINTNAAWLGQQIAALGLVVSRHLVVSDGAVIKDAMAEAAARSDVVLVSGGLGPTNDDLTRDSIAELLGLPMELDENLKAQLEAFFAKRNRAMSASNLRQAMVPRGARVMDNPFGTAPGLYFPAELSHACGWNTHFFLMPGPPRELKPMMETHVEPRLRALLPDGASRTIRYFKVTGLGESDIVERVEKKLEAVPGLILGYCIRQGDVDVRLSGQPGPVAEGDAIVREHLGEHIVSTDRRLIEQVVVQTLAERGQWLATAESCTGGFLSSRITDVSGSSGVFGHGFITYANEAKHQHLAVPTEWIEQHGAVSEPVAKAMAEGALRVSGADHALALTGIAGPTGGSENKPAGTVFIGLASKGAETVVKRFFYPGTRDRFKLLASQAALDMLRRRLMRLPL